MSDPAGDESSSSAPSTTEASTTTVVTTTNPPTTTLAPTTTSTTTTAAPPTAVIASYDEFVASAALVAEDPPSDFIGAFSAYVDLDNPKEGDGVWTVAVAGSAALTVSFTMDETQQVAEISVLGLPILDPSLTENELITVFSGAVEYVVAVLEPEFDAEEIGAVTQGAAGEPGAPISLNERSYTLFVEPGVFHFLVTSHADQ